MDPATFAGLRVAAFALALLPALVTTLRTEAIPNRENAIAFFAGLAVAIAGAVLAGASLPWLFWGLAAVGLVALFMTRVVGGGVIKLLIALLPWFGDPGTYLAAFSVGFIATALAGYLLGRDKVPAAPALYLAGLAALAWTAAG